MKRKLTRHPNEMIKMAITKYENGAKLAAIARELKVSKTTVKYWLDNASKFIPDSDNKNPIVSRLGQRLVRESWDIVFSSLKELKSKLAEMSGRDLVVVISELLDLQSRFGSMAGKNTVPDRVIEKSEEVRITVQKYLEKQKPEQVCLSTQPIECESQQICELAQNTEEAQNEAKNDSKQP